MKLCYYFYSKLFYNLYVKIKVKKVNQFFFILLNLYYLGINLTLINKYIKPIFNKIIILKLSNKGILICFNIYNLVIIYTILLALLINQICYFCYYFIFFLLNYNYTYNFIIRHIMYGIGSYYQWKTPFFLIIIELKNNTFNFFYLLILSNEIIFVYLYKLNRYYFLLIDTIYLPTYLIFLIKILSSIILILFNFKKPIIIIYLKSGSKKILLKVFKKYRDFSNTLFYNSFIKFKQKYLFYIMYNSVLRLSGLSSNFILLQY
jgi:hypothetical protein